MRLTLILCAVTCLWACATPQPEPIDPVKSEEAYRARSLSDPGLKAFIEANRMVEAKDLSPRTWDLEALTLVAFYYHPDLDIARAQFQQQEAGITTAKAVPNPTVGLEVQRVMGHVQLLTPWTYGFNLNLPVDELWKRGHRISAAEGLSAAARFALAETAWRARSRLRAALLDHVLAMKDLELRRVEEAVRAEVVKIMELRLALGETFRLDVDSAKARHAAAQLEIHASEGQVAESRTILAGALGVPVGALEGVTFGWPDLEKLPAEGELSLDKVQIAGLLNRLDVLRSLAEYAAAEAALQLEVSKRYPDISLGPGFLYDQGDKKFTLGLAVTLPVFNQNQGPIAEADARRKEIAARFLSFQAQAIREMEGALARYRSAVSEHHAALRMTVALQASEKGVRRQVELGESDRVSLTGVRLESILGSQSRLTALRKAQSALGSLEDAVQRPLGSAAPLPEAPLTNPRERR